MPALVVAPGEHNWLVKKTALLSAHPPRRGWAARRAVDVLRCSQPAEHSWPSLASKSSILDLARKIGVRTPWTSKLPRKGLAPSAAARLAARAPLVIKTDEDGNGGGVTICFDAPCAAARFAALAARQQTADVQQFVSGPTLTYDAVAMDGHTLGGVARAEVITHGQRGTAVVSRTIDCPQAADAVRRLFAHVGFTGVGASDFIVDSRTGDVLMIDPNPRFGYGQLLDGHALGIGDSLFARLRAAMLLSAASPSSRAGWPEPAPLAHSIAYMRFAEVHTHMFERMGDVAYCPDVYVPMPWTMPRMLRAIAHDELDVASESCSIRELRDPELGITQMCGRRGSACDGRCLPLATTTPVPGVAELLAAGGLCDPTSAWARAHFGCRRAARRAAARARATAGDGSAVTAATGVTAPPKQLEEELPPYSPAAWGERYGLSFCHNWSAPAAPSRTERM